MAKQPTLIHPTQDFQTIADLEKDASLQLLSDDEAERLKRDYSELYADELDDLHGFFVEIRRGEYMRVFGFHGSVPNLDKQVTRLKTITELLSEISERSTTR